MSADESNTKVGSETRGEPEVAPVDAHARSTDAYPAVWGTLEALPAGTPEELEASTAQLLAKLTLDEKLELLAGAPISFGRLRASMRRYNATPIVAGALPRLGIPGVRFTDGPRGVVVRSSTAFPVAIARGATFDPDLEARIGDAIGVEARTQGANLFAGVCINLLRHPAWGRAQETYGEDTHLLGAMGAALVRGVQRHLMACVKHYAVNSIENSRFWVDVAIDERTLRDLYLPHFRACVDVGAACVMSAYNKMNGTFCGHHPLLLRDILKDEWGFEGFVMSDFLFGVRDARAAMAGGQDLEMPYRFRFRALARLVRRGTVTAARIDDSVRRILRQQIRFAHVGEPERYRQDAIASEAHRALAREAAEKSMVLLRNEPLAETAAPLLPLPADPSLRIALFGRLATKEMIGDHGSSRVYPPHVVTVAQGLQALAAESGWQIGDVTGLGAEQATGPAALADVCVVVVGSSHRDEGEFMITHGGDRSSLRLRAADEALIARVARANPRTVVVLIGGSAFVTERWRAKVPAILMAWYPGMEGGHAIARVLAGLVDPSGRLPMTWPAHEAELPPFARWTRRVAYGPLHGYRLAEAARLAPAYWFGFGLSYTSFGLGNAVREQDGEDLVVRVPVWNGGQRDGVTVVQLYAEQRLGSDRLARRTLCGFHRVALAAAEERTIEIRIGGAALRTLGEHSVGPLRLWTGFCADPMGLRAVADADV